MGHLGTSHLYGFIVFLVIVFVVIPTHDAFIHTKLYNNVITETQHIVPHIQTQYQSHMCNQRKRCIPLAMVQTDNPTTALEKEERAAEDGVHFIVFCLFKMGLTNGLDLDGPVILQDYGRH